MEKLWITLLVIVGLGGFIFSGCERDTEPKKHDVASILKAKNKIIGLTETALRGEFPEMTDLSPSFRTLVLKSIYPYLVPKENKLLRFGSFYLVAELHDGVVIAIHSVSG